MVEATPPPVSYEEFLAWPGGGKREWVAGRIEAVEPSNFDHDQLREFIGRTVSDYNAETDAGFVSGESYVQQLDDRGRAPDVSFFERITAVD